MGSRMADKLLIVASTNAKIGMADGLAALRRGGSALDAVEIVIRAVESDPTDHSVGYSGIPNLLGQVELDASIMDGADRRAGAVGALRGYEHPISVARKVMETLPHVFLVGEGAALFAAEMGFEPRDLLDAEARRIWREGLDQYQNDPGRARYVDAIRSHTAAVSKAAEAPTHGEPVGQPGLHERSRLASDPERAARAANPADPAHYVEPKETVNVIAVDSSGNIASGASTSGWAWKYPGRLGDSPVIGAGNFADARYGAAACTGRGELAIRAATARSVVLAMKHGRSLAEACVEAMAEIASLPDEYHSAFSIIAIDAKGNHLAVSNRPDTTYVYVTDQSYSPVEASRQLIF